MHLAFRRRRALAPLALALLAALPAVSPLRADDDDRRDRDDDRKSHSSRWFRRVATFPVFRNGTIEDAAVAEIVAATSNGRLLVHTDSVNERVGFVDIADPSDPQADGVLDVGGEPTSVAVLDDDLALVCVDTSADFVNTSGVLQVVDLDTRAIVRSIPLGGQPDCIALHPNGRHAVIAIENERDEELGDGAPPQLPAGFVVIVDRLNKSPATWTTRRVGLVGVPDLYPTDPEPEFVDVSSSGIAAVTLQENNHVVLIDVRTGAIVADWSAGSVDLADVDVVEDEQITLDGVLLDVLREPDAVAWIDDDVLATANEGDLVGGCRSFTVFRRGGTRLFEARSRLEHEIVRAGHYPEDRSENKGNEPEAVEYGKFGGDELLFVGSERSNTLLVYDVDEPRRPRLRQVLPTGVGPEGVLAIPRRDLLVVASEEDARDDHYRSVITIYRRGRGAPTYPTIESADGPDGLPIPWVALSALAADPMDASRCFTAHDSVMRGSRIYEVDLASDPATIVDAIPIRTAGGDPVDLDVEGLCVSASGGFWVASEGAGAATTRNLLIETDDGGTILRTVGLPAAVDALQVQYGFEGVAAVPVAGGEHVYVAFQRAWTGDPATRVRIGRYDTVADAWTFFYYPLDAVESPFGGWVGLSELTWLGGGRFAVVERDNQGGDDARIKRLYEFSVTGLVPAPQGGAFPLLTKSLLRDLVPDLLAGGGPLLEKVEGFTVLPNGEALLVTDNDGVSDATGETRFLPLGDLD
jgi:hypothetical protein